MKLYTNPLSPNCRKVDAVAKQLGIELDYEPVDFAAGQHKTPEFLALNPNGKVPVLVDGDIKLWESNAICGYIASKSESSLWPKSQVRYDIMRWQSWELAHLGQATGVLLSERMLKPMRGAPVDEAREAAALEDFNRYAEVLDNHLGEQPWLVGKGLTIADFCVASTLTYAVPCRLPLEERANIRRWLTALDDQPGWAGSAPPPM